MQLIARYRNGGFEALADGVMAFKKHNIEIPFPQRVEYSMVWPPEQHTPNTGA